MKRIIYIVTLIVLLSTSVVAHADNLLNMSSAIGRDLDRQIERAGLSTGLSLVITTPVNINDLEETSTISRQVQEELFRWFVASGYKVKEVKASKNILLEDSTGELALTRKSSNLVDDKSGVNAIITGTYLVTSNSVKFNIKVIQAGTQNVIAMSSMSIGLNHELAMLVNNSKSSYSASFTPTSYTTLP